MDYEIVWLNEKTLTVLKPLRVSNLDPKVSDHIGLMWQDFYQNCSQVQNKITGKVVCTYSSYQNDEKGEYDVQIGYETLHKGDLKNIWTWKVIPAGRYAKFVIRGNMSKEVPNLWCKIWNMDLPRKFDCDFEEYQTSNPMDTENHVYISLT